MLTVSTKRTRKYRRRPQVIGKPNHWFHDMKVGGRGGTEAKLPCDPKMPSDCWSTKDDFRRKLTGGFERKSYTTRMRSILEPDDI